MPEDNRRYISRIGRTEGPYTVDEIHDLIADQKADFNTLFWSARKNAWKSITGLMLDVDPDKLDEFLRDGVKEIRILGSGGKDCYACAQLVDKVFPIGRQPILPPVACRCVPWCRLVVAPVTENTGN
jgi:hypothetical protein